MDGRVAVGHPVDVASGALFDTWTDFELPGGVPICFERYYSTALIHSPRGGQCLGRGWRHCYEHSLRRTLEGFVYVDETGDEIPLEDLSGEFETKGRLLCPELQIEMLKRPDGKVSLIKYPDGAPQWYLVFEDAGYTGFRLKALEKNPRNRLDFSHDNTGRLVRLQQSRTGRSLRFKYDTHSRLETVVLEGSRPQLLAAYSYDAQGCLTKVGDGHRTLWQFEYDSAGRMRTEASVAGAVWTFAFDAEDRCIHAVGSDGYEERWLRYFPASRITEVADSHGHVTHYEYNSSGQVTKQVSPLGARTVYDYDEAGRLIAMTDANNQRAVLQFDAQGHLCELQLPTGERAQLHFDDAHHVTELVDWQGLVWTHAYDTDGNLIHFARPGEDAWRIQYNEYGECTEIRNPLGHAFRAFWDASGNCTARIDWSGHTWRSTYDEQGAVLTETDPSGATSKFEYDVQGNLVRRHLADGRTWEYQCDPAGYPVVIKAPDGGKHSYLYSACGKLLQYVDGRGVSLSFRWDTEPGRLLEICNSRGDTYCREYDADGRCTKEKHWDGRTHVFEYDGIGGCIAMVDAAGRRVEYGYDEVGRLRKCKEADGTETTFAFDSNDQLIQITRGDSKVGLTRDAFGNVLEEAQGDVVVRSRYDALDQVIAMELPGGQQLSAEWNASGHCTALHTPAGTLRFRHDFVGREVERALPGGATFTSTYDLVGRLTEQCYLPAGYSKELPQVSSQGIGRETPFRRTYAYGTDGHVSQIRDSFRGWSHYIHNKADFLVGALHADRPSRFFSYDGIGNRLASVSVEKDQASEVVISALAGATEAQLGEILDVLSRRGATVEKAEYRRGNQLARTASREREISCEYDASGQLVRKVVRKSDGSTESWECTWNANGELVQVRVPSGDVWTYIYDGLGRRISKKGPDGETHFRWSGPVVVQEMNAATGEAISFAYIPQTYTPLAVMADSTYFLLQDQVDQATEAVNLDGTLIWVGYQDSWGEMGPNSADQRARFRGQWFDPETGWHYNFHRYYDPQLGRYISPDPIGMWGGFNEYAYVPSPLEWDDPEGLVNRGRVNAVRNTNGQWQYQAVPGGRWVNVPKTKCAMSGYVRLPDGTTAHHAGFVSGKIPEGGPAHHSFVTANTTRHGDNGNWTHTEAHGGTMYLGLADLNQIPEGSTIVWRIKLRPCDRGRKGGCTDLIARMREYLDPRGIELKTDPRPKGKRQRKNC